MKKVKIIFITLILLTITGCSDKDVIKHHYVFKGENDDWSVIYEVTAKETFTTIDGALHYDCKSKKIYTATYKKDSSKLAANKHIEISYKSSTGERGLAQDIDQVNPQKNYYMNSSNGSFENADEVIDVKINLDGNVQTIELKAK